MKDHPRACGENQGKTAEPRRGIGSPPRVRGKLSVRAVAQPGERITPARAGKTHPDSAGYDPARDHPRACGENHYPAQPLPARKGSPPRVRGKLPLPSLLWLHPRITPARAGKTGSSATAGSSATDHPRACGENEMAAAGRVCTGGSPPRVRGKPLELLGERFALGITPARAGKTPRISAPHPAAGDHPRACGENFPVWTMLISSHGSPPRVRGKRASISTARR